VSTEFFDKFVAAWLKHADAGSSPEGQANVQEFLACLSADVTWEDVPSGHFFSGHEGVTQACAIVSDTYDVALKVVGAQVDDQRFAIEFESRVTVEATGNEVVSRGVTVGTITDGKISAMRDYYDRSALNEAAA